MIKENKLDAILIDPYDQSVSRVDVDDDLQSIYEVMQCGLIEVVYLPNNQLLVIDEEGRLNAKNRWFKIGDNAYAGRSLLLGNTSEGDFMSTDCTVDEIFNTVSFEEEGYYEEPQMFFMPLN